MLSYISNASKTVRSARAARLTVLLCNLIRQAFEAVYISLGDLGVRCKPQHTLPTHQADCAQLSNVHKIKFILLHPQVPDFAIQTFPSSPLLLKIEAVRPESQLLENRITMDPLTALGLASNVFSFVSFASGLIKGTLEIRASANGCNIDVMRLDITCQQLQDLCEGLQSCTEKRIPEWLAEDHVAKVFISVKSLCTACKDDGDELLRITKTLRTKDGSRGKWDSFTVALRKAWKKSSIDELETRLSQTQTTMTLHICTLAQ